MIRFKERHINVHYYVIFYLIIRLIQLIYYPAKSEL